MCTGLDSSTLRDTMILSDCLAKSVETCSKKKGLNTLLDTAAQLRHAGKFAKARDILDELAENPNASLLGHKTSLGLPRRLHSALLKLAKAEKDAVDSIGYQFHLVPPPALLAAYTCFSTEHRKAVVEANRQAVPRKIHQIWIGSDSPPVGTGAWQEHAKTHAYDYQLWNENDLNALGLNKNAVYQDMLLKGDFPGAVDVARYVILKQYGGIYLDCDWYPTRNDVSFHDFMPMIGLVTMAENIPRNTGKGGLLLANSMIATPPEHPVFTRLIDVLDDVMNALPDEPAWWVSGPLVFTLVSRGGSVTLADADLVAGSLPQSTPLADVEQWCREAQARDLGLFLAWKSWVWR